MSQAATVSGLVRVSDPGIVGIEVVPLASLRPAKVNDGIYKPVDTSDASVQELAASIRDQGLLQPIDVTLDDVIVSGHRRRVACLLAGLKEVKICRRSMLSTDPNFVKLLVSFNDQRVKTVQEQIREAVVKVDKEAAYADLIAYRRAESNRAHQAAVDSGARIVEVKTARRRPSISKGKRPMLDAAVRVLEANREYWPLTVRQVHYRLLNDPPLRHASKPRSRYQNNKACYNDLSNILSRGRLEGSVPWDSLHDPTRPQIEWRNWSNPEPFLRDEMNNLLRGYRRDLLQSQAAYYEVVGEKITVQSFIERVAGEYGMPYCIGRGYSSVDLRKQLADRFKASHKDRLVLFLVNDFDPEGENITETLPSSLRDEFGVKDITPVKVAITIEQVEAFGLPPGGKAKKDSTRSKEFVAKNGDDVFELEALPPGDLEQLLREAIEGCIDMDLFREEQSREADDAMHLDAHRRTIQEMFTQNPD